MNRYSLLNRLSSSTDTAPDWHVRYDNMLDVLKRGLDNQYWQGIGEMLDDYLTMREAGYSISDFARKYHLSDRQLKRFLKMVSTESRQILMAA